MRGTTLALVALAAGVCGDTGEVVEPSGRSSPGPGIEVAWGEGIEIASGRGYRGPWRMNDSRFLYVDDPTVALDERGVVGVVWADQARKDLFFQSFGPEGEPRLEEPVNVSRTPRVFSWLPRLVISPGEPPAIFVLWQEIVFSGGSHGGEIFFSRSTDGGRSFSRPMNLSSSRAGDGKGRLTKRRWHNGSLDLVRGPGGDLYAAWTEYEGTLWLSRSTDGGGSFSPPVAVAGGGDAPPARGPSLAVDAEGTVFLAWTVGGDRAADVRVVSSEDGGRSFREPRIVFASDGHSDAPKVAVDAAGTVHLVFDESPSGPFGESRDLYTRWDQGGGWFEEPRRISEPRPPGFGGAAFPSLSPGPPTDSGGSLFVLWELYPEGARRSRGLGYTHSSDGGESFAPPSVVPGTADPGLGINGSLQGLLMRKLAVNRSGDVAVVHSTFREGQESRVRLFRGEVALTARDQGPGASPRGP